MAIFKPILATNKQSRNYFIKGSLNSFAIVQPRWGRMREYRIPRVRSATLGFVVKRRWRIRLRLRCLGKDG